MLGDFTTKRLTGWGLTSPSSANVATVTNANVAKFVGVASSRGIISRGLGRSYGDAAQNAGGVVLQLSDSADDAVLDSGKGVLTCGAGVSLHDILKLIVPRGFFVPVTAGTRFVTVGGAIAADIHGKNHHGDGSFGNHLERMSLLLADGRVEELSPTMNAPLFWATIGGMGLTGIILEATFSLIPIETSLCSVDTIRCDNIDDLMAEMLQGDGDHRYSVAWADLLATGKHLGRSVLWRGDHARLSQLSARQSQNPLQYEPRHLATVPPLVPSRGFVNRISSLAFNELWFRKEPRRQTQQLKTIPSYFHPLDAIGSWNKLYGSEGFLQYQFVLPFGREDVLRKIVEKISTSKHASPLVVLKCFGTSNEAPLSFPMPGWTLTVDVPTRSSDLAVLLHQLDEMVCGAGGRHYLAKDAHTTPEAICRGYPRLEEWKAVRRSVDPDGLWQSDLARRLDLM